MLSLLLCPLKDPETGILSTMLLSKQQATREDMLGLVPSPDILQGMNDPALYRVVTVMPWESKEETYVSDLKSWLPEIEMRIKLMCALTGVKPSELELCLAATFDKCPTRPRRQIKDMQTLLILDAAFVTDQMAFGA